MSGMNKFYVLNPHERNRMKKHYHRLIDSILGACDTEPYKKYRVKYKFYYKTKSCDLMNVVSIIDKFFNDSMQTLGYVVNDNVSGYKKCFAEVVEQDKEDPRVEICLEELE